MGKIKLTKGELKRQREALSQYERYLPTLQLKKQQLQLEILHQYNILEDKNRQLLDKISAAQSWGGFLAEGYLEKHWLIPEQVITGPKNIAGVDISLFERAQFRQAEYDLFVTPLWVDTALDELRAVVSFKEEIRVIKQGIGILKHELRITAQRVNLFEKIKIPEAEEAIRVIKIYLGDQMSNAVGRSKIAKLKIDKFSFEEAPV
ncbi:MAG: V-type ATP synthase subunit D [Candidatus Omnitrophica bacterium]|nr:V-type ATP synthase subunit D [Candidatus Omnitrophota bacterium]